MHSTEMAFPKLSVRITHIVYLLFLCAEFTAQDQMENETFITSEPIRYHNNDEIGKLFNRLQAEYPHLVRKYSIGKTVQGRDINVLAISYATSIGASSSRRLLHPAVKLSANINGDETLGREMILFLAQYLTTNYENVPDVQKLLNNTEIHLLPSCNPDGFFAAKEGYCESLPNYVGRRNAAGVDLNRDFPDRLDSQRITVVRSKARQPETAALIEWILSNPFVLSANFHGGALVASYPYDNSIDHRECCKESLTPDDRVFKLMAHTYAENHPLMRNGNSCNDTFSNGITNGANWYELNGGMQDFNYAFTNCFEITIELSCCKYPLASSLPTEWLQNKNSLLQFLKLAHIGIKGLVKDASDYPIKDANIIVSGLEEKPIRTTQRGEYWRLLAPGLYKVQALAFGYQPSEPQEIKVTNEYNEALRLDFILTPVVPDYDATFRSKENEPTDTNNNGFSTPTKFEHHNFTSMEKYLRNIADSYPTITRLYSIGSSVQGRNLWVMEIFVTPGQHVPGKPEFKYVANMHGNEVVGKELLLLLTKYLCENYLIDLRITSLINNTRMHFLYSMNPDGYEVSVEGDKTSARGRFNANAVDLNRNFPDQYGIGNFNRVPEPEVSAVMNWTLSLPFVLSANLHGGSLVANYPFDDNENDFTDTLTQLRVTNLRNRKMNPTEDNELFKHLALVYSKAHPTMHLGEPCPLFKNEVFPQGITNGAEWYSVTGGMQDWNYVRAGVMELTIELGCDKFPFGAELSKYWLDNRESLLVFIEQIHYGVHGFIKSSIGSSIAGVRISLDGAKHAVYSDTQGYYWKLALPGHHNITFFADGFAQHSDVIEIPSEGNRSIHLDVTLMRDDPQHWSSAYDYRIIANVVNTKYHTNFEMLQKFSEFEKLNRQIVSFDYIENEYYLLKITANIGEPEESKNNILFVSSLFDSNSPLGREVIINLIRHVIEGYKLREPNILTLLQRSVLHFMQLTEKIDIIAELFERNNSICDPIISDELADRILNQQSEERRHFILKFLETKRFDLMLTFTAGISEVMYPKGDTIFENFARNIEGSANFPALQCSSTTARNFHYDSTKRLTNLFYKIYDVPMFSLSLSCCRMPPQKQIAAIWRKNLKQLKSFLSLINTGIIGHVQNKNGQPLRTAFIRIQNHNSVYNVTKNSARFQIILPQGAYSLEINAPDYQSHIERVTIVQQGIVDLGAMQLRPIKPSDSEILDFGTSAMLTSSISGYILDMSNHPIANAKVEIIARNTKQRIYNLTDSFGAFKICNVPVGDITVKIEASHYLDTTRIVHVHSTEAAASSLVMRLEHTDHVLGISRLLFIALASVAVILSCLVLVICIQFLFLRRRRFRGRYNFSMVPQMGKDEDEFLNDGDTDIFRTPIKKGMSVQPYFDADAVNEITITDEENFTEGSADESISFEKRKL